MRWLPPGTGRVWWISGVVLLAAALAALVMMGYRPGATSTPLSVTDEVCVVAPPTPYDAASGVSLHAPRTVPADARCPVCGMFPARSPSWAAQVIFQDGATQFFDSPLSLFVYLQEVSRYTPGRQVHDIAARYVRDTDAGGWVDAQDAVYVSGSSALGPMRAGNLPAFADAKAAQAFAHERGGVVLRATQISPAILQKLNGVKNHRHLDDRG